MGKEVGRWVRRWGGKQGRCKIHTSNTVGLTMMSFLLGHRPHKITFASDYNLPCSTSGADPTWPCLRLPPAS